MTRPTFRTFALLAVLALALTAPAAAQSPSLEGYSGPGGKTQSRIQDQSQAQDGDGQPQGQRGDDDPSGSDDASSASSRSGDGATLPFTGADLGWFGAVGLALLLFGFALRRLTAPARQPSG